MRERLQYVEEEFSSRLAIIEERIHLMSNDISKPLDQAAHHEVIAFDITWCPLDIKHYFHRCQRGNGLLTNLAVDWPL
jgi:hypothetical protein